MGGNTGDGRPSGEPRRVESIMRRSDTPSGRFYYFIAVELYTNRHYYTEYIFKRVTSYYRVKHYSYIKGPIQASIGTIKVSVFFLFPTEFL